MAIAFLLVADFGREKASAESCREWFDTRIRSVEIDDYSIKIHPPLISGYPYTNPTRFHLSIVPANVGCCVALDESEEQIPLTGAQLSRLGLSLYDMLRGAPGYQLAMVGWDVDFLLDVDELTAHWSFEISDESFSGLVARKSLLFKLPKSSCFTDFDDDHVWIPYAGSNAIGPTTPA